jgi:hypothetical protein
MYALVDGKPFKNEMELKMLVPDFLPIFASNGTTVIPYTHEQTLKIMAEFACKKNYYNTVCNIYRAVYNVLDTHVEMMRSKPHPPPFPQQLDGILQCHSTRFLTSS